MIVSCVFNQRKKCIELVMRQENYVMRVQNKFQNNILTKPEIKDLIKQYKNKIKDYE